MYFGVFNEVLMFNSRKNVQSLMVSGSPLPGEEGDEVLTMVGTPGAASLRVECRFGV